LKRLIVNADDFGFTRDVNDGIVHACRGGILTATTLMATGPAFEHAVELARANPGLDIGVHVVLVGAPGYPSTIGRLIQAIALGRISIYDEIARQVRRILDAGIQPSHLDTHKHTHLLPPVLDAVTQVASEFKIPWIRRPFDLPLHAASTGWRKRLVSNSFSIVRRRFQLAIAGRGCSTTDYFAGFQMTGRYDARELATLIRSLPDGLTEFMCHPGFCTEELLAARTRLKESRRRELDALTSPEVRAALRESNVRLTRYCEIRPQVLK
jgi:chitin disaccharide deacetylase